VADRSLGIVSDVAQAALPNVPRIASPSFDRSIGVDVLLIGATALAAPIAIPAAGAPVMLVGLFLAALVAMRRRTMGAYAGEDALVIRGYLSTISIGWREAHTVVTRRDGWLPWLQVAAVIGPDDGAPVPITALRHRGAPPSPALTLTRIVRDHREGRDRRVWDR
jgi:hypothetical protein